VRGDGLRTLPLGHLDRLGDYADHLACGLLPAPEPLRAVEHRVVGGTAGEREADCPGSGEFPLAARGADVQPLTAGLDGWAFFAPDPDALVAVLRRLAEE
jgi:hypothetical protein